MKRTVLSCLIGFGVAFLFIGIPFTIWHISTSKPAYQQTKWFNYLVELQSALQIYSLDAKTAGNSLILPDSLEGLVTNGYLTKNDLDRITHSFTIHYNPSAESSPLSIETDRYLATVPLKGDITVRKK